MTSFPTKDSKADMLSLHPQDEFISCGVTSTSMGDSYAPLPSQSQVGLEKISMGKFLLPPLPPLSLDSSPPPPPPQELTFTPPPPPMPDIELESDSKESTGSLENARLLDHSVSVILPRTSPRSSPVPPPLPPPDSPQNRRKQLQPMSPESNDFVPPAKQDLEPTGIPRGPQLFEVESTRPAQTTPRWGSRDVGCFDIVKQVGEGTYGEVYMARCKETKEIVALKKIRMDREKEGFPITAIREIKILKSLDHPNIVNLKEIVTSTENQGDKSKGSVYLVFEYMDFDLSGLLDTPNVRLSRLHIKCYMKQLLEGAAYMHKNRILHRDIKGPNLLLDNRGRLKIADWGLARSRSERNEKIGLTNNVITLWYRPPELLMGETHYDASVDMWSVGCIFAELLFGKPILPGRDELDQLRLIFALCGSPTKESWQSFDQLPNAKNMASKEFLSSTMKQTFRMFSADELDLVERLLALDPKKRISAVDALDHNYFWSEPIPCQPHELPKFRVTAAHEYEAKKRRLQERQSSSGKDLSKKARFHHYHPYQHHRDRDRDRSDSSNSHRPSSSHPYHHH